MPSAKLSDTIVVAMTTPVPRRRFLRTASLAGLAGMAACAPRERTAVLTFDDAVRSHRTFVAPLLADLGFSATFFVTRCWMDDRDNFMSWEEIAEIAEMGFEIGNHSWSHSNFSTPKNAARLEGELALVDNALAKVGVEKPISFAWCGNLFGPEALSKLNELGYRFGRRGLSPELEDHALELGPAYDPSRHHRLLIPTTGNAIPDWSLEFFKRVLDRASEGVVVLQFHGVPDVAHDWVHTPPERFRKYMEELSRRGFSVLALRDLESPAEPTNDPNVNVRNAVAGAAPEQPVELAATRANLSVWTDTMLRHRYSEDEAAAVAGFSAAERADYRLRLGEAAAPAPGPVEVWPYPGGRHPRIGFLEGAIDPLRGSKASVFLPWDPASYVVVDLPELISSDLGHLFLAHTHVPTIWNEQNVWLDNVDWQRTPGGGLMLEWTLPNGVVFGSSLRPDRDGVELGLWLRNSLDEGLKGLRTQLCVMLRGAPEFNAQTRDNKIFKPPAAAVESKDGGRWVLTAWERTGRSWGNPRCPCLHADPVFPDCAPGETVRLKGRLWFHEGSSVEDEIAAASRRFQALASAEPAA